MTVATRRLFVHIGLHKTGTTFLQNKLRANRPALLEQGVLFPGGPGEPTQILAAWDLLGRRPRGVGDTRISGTWQTTVDVIRASDCTTVLIADEHLSLASIANVRRLVDSFPSHEVHVVVTVRDLGRIFVSSWQEAVKNTATWTWREYSDAVQDDSRRSTSPARGFWMRQDFPAILAVWRTAVPPERIHVVTVPRSGASPDLLMQRYGAAVGFDPDRLMEEAPYTNETIGVAGTEVLRRLNGEIGSLNQRQYDRAIKQAVVRILAERSKPVRFVLPEEDFAWTHERGMLMVEDIRAHGYDVVGDLADLEPVRTDGRRPDEVSEVEVLEASVTALAGLSETYARSWWAAKRPYVSADDLPRRAKITSDARAAAYRGKRLAARIADRNRVAAKGVDLALRIRQRRAARG